MNPTLTNALTVIALFGGAFAVTVILFGLEAMARRWRSIRQLRRWRGTRRL